ncbi:serine/threonine-protein kinase [Asanoa iriomotensis]|uniref:non-specific serine/threonine protein kinase n=1 Tax=Asanoa iriomotensis TaxID=234613 RepID=A0ABQ4C475_9ACTN|nr:serine/threonine-protein kinase [Asanoa iriomotensis]GIF57586.1 hypothetical protein Air01nite_36810 [Asanoa iriomotensis]
MARRRLADRYELEEVVAEGGMGVVWRGRDLRLDRAVAVKLVSGDVLADPTMVERFDREAHAVARLNHPNIVSVYDFGSDGADSYLVMELVAGRSVASLLGDGPLPVGEAVAVATQACAGLAAAHAAGVVHRDVKPANLIRTPSGIVKICDFGIAHLQHVTAGQARLTAAETAMGSTSYMAPEQVMGGPVDARTDLYGLGCTIHAMLTGAPPFVGATPYAVVHHHVTTPAPDVRAVRPDAPVWLSELVDDLLAKAPESRPADAASVAGRLAVVGDAPPAPPGPRRRWGVAAGGAAVLAAVAVASLLAATRDDPPTTTATPPPASVVAVPPAVPTSSPSPSRPVVVQSTRPPTPSPSRPAPTRTPVDPVAGLHRTIDAEAAADLDPKQAEDLHKKVDDIVRHLREGDEPGAAKRIKDLRTKLTDLHDHDKLTDLGYTALNRDLDRLAGT